MPCPLAHRPHAAGIVERNGLTRSRPACFKPPPARAARSRLTRGWPTPGKLTRSRPIHRHGSPCRPPGLGPLLATIDPVCPRWVRPCIRHPRTPLGRRHTCFAADINPASTIIHRAPYTHLFELRRLYLSHNKTPPERTIRLTTGVCLVSIASNQQVDTLILSQVRHM